MKNLFTVILCLVAMSSFAQIQQNSRVLGGEFNSIFSQNYGNLAATAQYSHFITNHFAIGGNVALQNTAISNTYNGSNLAGGVNVTYVINPSAKTVFYLNGIYLAGNININTLGRITYHSSNISAGMYRFLNTNLAFSANIRYDSYNYGGLASKKYPAFSVGLTPFLQGGLIATMEDEEMPFKEGRISVNGDLIVAQDTFLYSRLGNSVLGGTINMEGSYYFTKIFEMGLGVKNKRFNLFAALNLPFSNRFAVVSEIRYYRAFEEETDSNKLVPSLGGMFFLNRNIAFLGKISYYRSSLRAFNLIGLDFNLKYFLR